MRRCPSCGLPIGCVGITVFSGSSNDGLTHGVFAVCVRCSHERSRLPAAIWNKRISRAGNRALAHPEKFLCTTYQTTGAARLALALLGHPAHSQETLKAMGWGDGMGDA
jgi:hypothetical protein